ncbi:hypothetical protein KI387_007825, partial [Taxus chinensis]
NHNYEEFPDLYEHLSKKHKQDKGTGMVRVQRIVEDQWMPKLAPDPEMVPVLVTTRTE